MHPHYTQWWQEQVDLVRQTGGLSALPIAEIQEKEPMSDDQEVTPEAAEEIQESKNAPKCEYCDKPLKSDKKQARSIHLRFCEVYKATKKEKKTNGHTQPAFDDGGAVALTPEQVSKLWQ